MPRDLALVERAIRQFPHAAYFREPFESDRWAGVLKLDTGLQTIIAPTSARFASARDLWSQMDYLVNSVATVCARPTRATPITTE